MSLNSFARDVYTPFEMAEKLARNIAFGIEALTVGLDVIGFTLEKTAKESIGTYQRGIGPFPGWSELAESTIWDKEKHGYAPPDNPLLRTGELRESITHSITFDTLIFGSKDQIMVYHEFGKSRMPMRPVIGPAVYRNKKRIKEVLGGAIIEGYFKGSKSALKIHSSLGYNFIL